MELKVLLEQQAQASRPDEPWEDDTKVRLDKRDALNENFHCT